jgi:hypothetical protein
MEFNKKHGRFHAGLACALYDAHYRNKFLTIQSITVLFNEISLDERVTTDAAVFKALRGAKNAEFDMKIGLKDDLGCKEGTIMVSREIRVDKDRFQCIVCFDSLKDVWSDNRIREWANTNPAPQSRL